MRDISTALLLVAVLWGAPPGHAAAGDFYVGGDLKRIWEEYRPRLQELADSYAPFGQQAPDEIVAFCRVPSGYFAEVSSGVHFTICPQMSHDTAYTVKIGGQLHIVHGPSSGEPGPGAFYHEALHHVVGPVVQANDARVQRSAELLKTAEEHHKLGYDDWSALVEESCVRTIDKILAARHCSLPEQRFRATIEDEYKLGFILSPYLSEALRSCSDGGGTFHDCFKTAMAEVDVSRETDRWNRFWASQEKPADGAH